MRFRILGPLEVWDGDDRPVVLGGVKQRATLGFLLLQANQVVATSQLLRALWAGDDAPTSARKILQNAVWGLRGVLAAQAESGGPGAALLTRVPGYLLQVAPEQIDLHHFQRQVDEGRKELAAGSPELSAPMLRRAIGLWRGPVLADLVETGIAWPELAAVQSMRLDAMEDCFEAELACGRHQAVLGELEALVEAEPLRERSCGQLMLALYRCGRQADALNVYARVRATLVEELGLEPGRELQELQRSILTHDPALALGPTRAAAVAPRPVVLRPADRPAPWVPPAELVADRAVPAPQRGAVLVGEAFVAPEPGPERAERRTVSVVTVRAQLGADFGGVSPEDVDEVLAGVAATIRERVECFGGTVAASIGSVTVALFGAGQGAEGGADQGAEDSAECAVRCALSIREWLCPPIGPLGGPPVPPRGLAIHAAVTTGEALVRHRTEEGVDRPSVQGALLDECQSLLAAVQPGEIRVSDSTRRSTERTIVYPRTDDAGNGWQVWGARRAHPSASVIPLVDRDCELEILGGLFQRARRRSAPHLVTVLGEAGIGKSRFLMEFERRIVGGPEPVRCLVARALPAAAGCTLAVAAELVCSYCGILATDSAEVGMERLTAEVTRLGRLAGPEWSAGRAAGMLAALRQLTSPGCAQSDRLEPAETLAAWREFMALAARDEPLVVIVDDLHQADGVLLDLVEPLVETAGAVPMLVVAAARPELLRRRPDWGGGHRHTTTITLDPLPDSAIDQLLDHLLATVGGPGEVRRPSRRFREAVLANVGAGPDERRRYVRSILCLEASSPAVLDVYADLTSARENLQVAQAS